MPTKFTNGAPASKASTRSKTLHTSGDSASGGSSAARTLPVPEKKVRMLVPIEVCGRTADGCRSPVLMLCLGKVNIKGLDRSGISSQDLLQICSSGLASFDGQGIVVVVDLEDATLLQLQSTWFTQFLPLLVAMLNQCHRGSLRALYVVRAERLAEVAARRVTKPLSGVPCCFMRGIHQRTLTDSGLDCVLEHIRPSLEPPLGSLTAGILSPRGQSAVAALFVVALLWLYIIFDLVLDPSVPLDIVSLMGLAVVFALAVMASGG